MTLCSAFLFATLWVVFTKSLAWLIQRQMGNAGIVDAIWAFSLGSLALGFAAVGPAPGSLRLLLAAMGGGWGLRLGWHLWRRNWRAAEDWRYAKLRLQWGAQASWKMWAFFQFQNVFTLALAASAFGPVAWRHDSPPQWAPWLAVAIWALSLVGEGVADAQLRRHQLQREGRPAVCDRGLWRYSRHPNYFFESVHWLAYVPLAWGTPWIAASLLAPLVMVMLLLKISGVPLLEAEMARRKPGYADYMQRTSMLLPWPPRRERAASDSHPGA